MLLAAVAEVLGLSMVIPLFSVILDITPPDQDITRHVERVVSLLPENSQIEYLISILVLLFIIRTALSVLRHAMAVDLGWRLEEQWTRGIFIGYLRGPYRKFVDTPQGKLVSNCRREPKRAARIIVGVADLAARSILSLLLLGSLFLVNWYVTSFILVVGIGIFYITRKSLGDYSSRFGERALSLHQRLSNVLIDSLSGIKEVKAYGMEPKSERRLNKVLARLRSEEVRFRIFSAAPNLLVELLIVVLLGAVVILIHSYSGIKLQDYIPLLGFMIVASQRLFSNLAFIVSHRMQILAAVPSLRTVYQLIHEIGDARERADGDDFDGLRGYVAFEDVGFAYNDERMVLNGLNMTIKKGEMTALVGASGLGKTTAADMLLGLYGPKKGRILVDDRDINELGLQSWRRKVGYVGQDTFLFNDTIEKNIAYGNSDASREDVIEAAMTAGIHDFITELPEGYETEVGQRGGRLSGGQRQRIAIARAVVRRPDLYIFDEATSSLDSRTERVVQNAIERLSKEKTVFVIAHRLLTVRNADRIYQLQSDGTAKEVTYSELEKQITGVEHDIENGLPEAAGRI